MTSTLFVLLAGLAALGFLLVVGRRRQMPAPLKIVLIIVALAIVVFVAWTLLALLGLVPGAAV